MLALSHLGTVCVAAAASTVVAVGLGILVTRPVGAEFLPLARTLVNIGQTFPPVAVLAHRRARWWASVRSRHSLALFAYGLLPIFENTIVGPADLPAGRAGVGERHGDERAASASGRWSCRWLCR